MSVTFYLAKEPPTTFEVNMSNGNARAFLIRLQILHSSDLTGQIPKERLTDLISAIYDMLIQEKFGDLIEPTRQEGNLVYCGRDKLYVRARLLGLLMLCAAAEATDQPILFG